MVINILKKPDSNTAIHTERTGETKSGVNTKELFKYYHGNKYTKLGTFNLKCKALNDTLLLKSYPVY